MKQADLRRRLEGATELGWTLGRSGLSYWLTTGDLSSDDLAFVRLVERHGIHNSYTSRYALQILGSPDLDRRGDSRWWVDEYAGREEFHSTLDVIVAGHALLRYAFEQGDIWKVDHQGQARPFDPPSRVAVKRLALALCRVASGNLGYAHEAMTIIAGLGSVVSEYVAEFIEASAIGSWVGRAGDGALRRAHEGRVVPVSPNLLTDYSRVSNLWVTDSDLPSRCMGHLRLLRRIGLCELSTDDREAKRTLLAVALDSSAPARWRRFALWCSAEPAVRDPDRHRKPFEAALHELQAVPDLIDVVAQLRSRNGSDRASGKPPEYRNWGKGNSAEFDIFKVDHHRGAPTAFAWHLPNGGATDSLLRDFTLRGYEVVGAAPASAYDPIMKHIGPDLRLRLLDVVHEALVHPGYIRVQAAAEMLSASGASVSEAVAQLVSRMLEAGGVLVKPDEYPQWFIDNCVLLLGVMRRASGIDSLVRATSLSDPVLKASAIWSIGDILSHPEEGDTATKRHGVEVIQVLQEGLRSQEVVVRRATLHALAVSRLSRVFTHEVAELSDDPLVKDWARWCQCMWQEPSVYLNTPAHLG